MKFSNKILFGSLFGIFCVCVVMLILIKIGFNVQAAPDKPPVHKSHDNVRRLTLSGLTRLDLKGKWRGVIVQGDNENILLKGPEELLTELEVKRYGPALSLRMPDRDNDKRKLFFDMTTSQLESLRSLGITDISFSGFTLNKLKIHSEGVTRISGKDGSAEKLDYKCRGVTDLDLEKFKIHAAELDCKGVMNIGLMMTGGGLSGKIEGAGQVRYGGAAGDRSLQVKGACKVGRI